ncbi:uncharacterized protein QC761_100278 [Podospora bellae-mahoneyi]|uniref:Uncharacterized protein n=1 Tax=Podospora bellae-mahoneyi TaxID=2093777 RepID=A0ABR0FTA9_9PEZI|nr:hypothetical protein QC761_100278 [Podospora bellae-mahoneyi]
MMAPVTKSGWLLLLQAATTLISGVSARCNSCKASDELLVLLRSEDVFSEALPFCSSVLGLPLETAEVTATEEVVITVTQATTVTQVISDISSVTVTVSAPVAPTSQAITVTEYKKHRRDTALASLPTWLPSGEDAYPDTRISSACHCLDRSSAIPLSTTTITHINPDNAVTVTEPATSTVISTLVSTVTATETLAPPAPSSTTISVAIQVLRKSTGQSVGWISNAASPNIATNQNSARRFTITIPDDQSTSSSGIRIQPVGGEATQALGFETAGGTTRIETYYGNMDYVPLTSANEPYVCDAQFCHATDIWTLDTETGSIGWNWVIPDGSVAPVVLYRVGGWMYAVGNLAAFMSSTSSAPSDTKYEITLRYVEIVETAPAAP